MSYEWHRYAAVFPLLDDDKIASLAADIKANGLKSPIVLFEGKVLDGRNRATACNLAGITPRYEEFKGTKQEALAHVWSLNFERRHLDPGQAAAAAVAREKFDEEFAKEVAEMKEDAAKRPNAGRPRTGENSRQKIDANFEKDDNTHRTDHKIAEAAGTNRTYIAHARKLRDEDPEEFQKVLQGTKKLNKAVKDMAAKKEESNGKEDKKAGGWPEMIKWASRQDKVTKYSLMKRFKNNEADCRKRLAIAAQTFGYIVRDIGNGEYRVHKAVTIASDCEGQAEYEAKLLDKTERYLKAKTSSDSCAEWSDQQQMEYLHEIKRYLIGRLG